MNKQKHGNGARGIEWTDYTWNPIRGCKHGCEWMMPNGAMANCYAEDTAKGVAQAAYPEGFEHHYFAPNILNEPLNLKQPSRIFAGSMADFFGHWVPIDELTQVMMTVQDAHWHTFQLLSKNLGRVISDNIGVHKNAWYGSSTPPDVFWGKLLTIGQRHKMLHHALKTLSLLAEKPVTTWLSAEPLSWDIVPILKQYPTAIRWIVIGAASEGKIKHQPHTDWVAGLVDHCDRFNIRVFYKGNLRDLPFAAANWREEFPV